ncbi:tetratricopeptide repeat protein [Pseudenhygromyxa sp. WMMC2535]|uniref:tetratricopeptide repeat protein n=1 Tax=Pseudenhygromyxa sp. WMMC2535 TaxID=2712867 RepID=UPI00155222E7|nr:tetratricopeptide repeat protein [Pseudenhygromyxa sp. WMMC2535]NVB41260.1 tetratricopeptide repeat protein [Pseudenhygromyxa sp. WMMC2535]
MAGDDEKPQEELEATAGAPTEGDLEGDPEGADAAEDEGEGEELEALQKAASEIELVLLPLACVNEGKGAPLSMGVQRWMAQELARTGLKAAAPVFTAIAEQQGRKVPALLIYRDPWTDSRALQGAARFPNARRAVSGNFFVSEDKLTLDLRLVEIHKDGSTPVDASEREEGEESDTPETVPGHLEEIATWSGEFQASELPTKLFEALQELAAKSGQTVEHADAKAAFGTEEIQATLSFLVGLGNLSALQGRTVPATTDQLLNPLMDAINRDPKFDAAMEALHGMVDILMAINPDRTTIPLSLQALSIAAQRRKDDVEAWHHLGVVARRLGDLPTAINAFNQAFNLAPTNVQVTVNFIQTLRQTQDTENALKVAQHAAENGNEAPPVLALLGSLLIENDDFDAAEPFLRRAVDEGQIPSAYGDLANVLWDRSDDDTSEQGEDREEAMKLLETAVGLAHVAKTALEMLLDLAVEEEDEKAIALLEAAGEKHGQNPAVLTSLATLRLEGEDPQEARPWLEKLLALPRRSLDDDAFGRRALLALELDDFEARYEAAIDQVNSGDLGKRNEAAVFLREVVAKDARYWQPHLMLALAVRESEGDAAALSHLMNAVRLRPNDAQIRQLIAGILRKQGRPREAVEHLRAVVALNPREVDPVIGLATCMRDANMFAEARQICTAALQMIPGHPQFQAILESLPQA